MKSGQHRIVPKAQKTLNEILGIRRPPAHASTGLVRRVYEAGEVPLEDLSDEELRVLLSQRLGVAHVIPLALARLEKELWCEATFYRGDLLVAAIGAESGLEKSDPSWSWLHEIAKQASSRVDELDEVERNAVVKALADFVKSEAGD